MRKTARRKNSKCDMHLEMGDAKERSPFERGWQIFTVLSSLFPCDHVFSSLIGKKYLLKQLP